MDRKKKKKLLQHDDITLMSKVACANLKEKHPSAIELPHCLVCNGSQANTGCNYGMNLGYEQLELEGKLLEV
jgi:hypothetical protein